MPTINDTVVSAVKNYLEASRKSDDLSHEKKEPKFYVSDLGKCLRMRWLKRKGIKGEYNWETYYTFEHGNFIHTLGYKAFEAAGILEASEQTIGNEHFSGRYDGKLRHNGKIYMFDFKSTNPYVLKRITGGGADNVENIMQVLAAIAFEKITNPKVDLEDVGAVIYWNKLPSDKIEPRIIHTKEYHFSIYKEEIEADMKKIVDYWLADKIPPCTCASWSTAQYNSFYTLCRMPEKEIRKYLGYIKAGNSVICKSVLKTAEETGISHWTNEITVQKFIGKEAE